MKINGGAMKINGGAIEINGGAMKINGGAASRAQARAGAHGEPSVAPLARQ